MASTHGAARPPRPAAWLLRQITSRRGADIEESLAELFRVRAVRDGRSAARRWYWRQVIGFALRRRAIRKGKGRRRSMDASFIDRAADGVSDLRLAARSLLHQPGFSALAIGTLAIGVAGNAVVFSILDGALWRPLTIPHAERLVSVGLWNTSADRGATPSFAQFREWKTSAGAAADAMFAYQSRWKMMELADGTVDEVTTEVVSPEYFSVLEARADRGRLLVASDYAADAPLAVVVSHGFWRDRLAADPDALGEVLEVNAIAYTVVGVLAPDFRFESFPDNLFLPLRSAGLGAAEAGEPVDVIARLPEGGTRERLETVLRGSVLEDPFGRSSGAAYIPVLEPIRAHLYGWVGERFGPFMGVVGFVLLLVSANLASLSLVRATSRRAEMGLRSALGAGRWRLARLVVAEVVVITTAAAGLALLLTSWTITLLLRFDLRGVRDTHLQFDVRVAGFTILVALLAGLIAALWPAFSALRTDSSAMRRQASHHSQAIAHRFAQRALVVLQVACALLLLTGAGLLTKTIVRMYRYDPGFDTRNLLTFYTTLPDRYGDDAARFRVVGEIIDRIRQVPGVVAASVMRPGGWIHSRVSETEGGVTLEGDAERLPAAMATETGTYNYHGAEYFETRGVPVVQGRSLVAADFDPSAPPVVLVNEEAARRWWPEAGGDVIGRRFKLGPPRSPNPWLTVVGVVRDTRPGSVMYVGREQAARVHLPLTRATGATTFYFEVRTAGSSLAMVPAIRALLKDTDPDLLVRNPEDVALSMAREVSYYRTSADIVAGFAAFGLLLAAMGVWAVVAYSVARRTREIGIRMALGAGGGAVLRTVTAESLVLAALGIAAGLGLAAGLTRVLDSMLFGVSPLDPLVFAIAAVGFMIVVALAAFFPARRATRVEPVLALRAE